MYHSPKYWKEMAKKRKELERQQAASREASVKRQAVQDEGDKHQAASGKGQASSRKRQAP
tara:strand:+ start:445 stop:624 length:180 start_codon:yes stop_codon:yes gene_type:complete